MNNITLTPEELQKLANYLGKQPFQDVYILIGMLETAAKKAVDSDKPSQLS